MLAIQKMVLLLAGVVGAQPAGSGPAPVVTLPAVTVRQVLTMQALAGEKVAVSGRCLGESAPTLARGTPPSGRVWQLEENGVAAWVAGPMPKGCEAGAVTITARVVQDTLPKFSLPRTVRQYLVVR